MLFRTAFNPVNEEVSTNLSFSALASSNAFDNITRAVVTAAIAIAILPNNKSPANFAPVDTANNPVKAAVSPLTAPVTVPKA